MENWSASTSLLGLVVMSVVVAGPLATLLGATIFGGPKGGNPKPVGGTVKKVFLGTMLSIVVGALVMTVVLSGVMSLIIPR
ncbi:MAG: hypothetical protein HY673_11765 [Chloroflexi bacterium]|nr:hypothetical protein [Chloroflexota bacterium]